MKTGDEAQPQPKSAGSARGGEAKGRHAADGAYIDRRVGERVRQRRRELKLSQMDLAAAMGVSFQQVQKYEVGANRASAARLVELGRALQVPVGYFFEELEGDHSTAQPSVAAALLSDPGGPALAEAYLRLKDPALRQAAVAAVRALAKGWKGD